jgi:peptidoglycan/LPS O-acetylase OafA/YrhL
VAVYLVLLFHTGMAAAGGGFIGVDLFFVLSGFLVSNVILSEIDLTGQLNLGRFYARRVRRLLPAAVVVVVATSAMFVLVASVVRRIPLVVDAQSALLYVANWRFLLQQNDYFATGVDESPFLHFWSLAIEEQFYLVFPLVLLLLARWSANRRAWLMPTVVAGLFALSLGSQVYWASVNPNWAYYGTDARLYQLLGGVLVALALRGTDRRPSTAVAGVGAVMALAAMLGLGSGLIEVSPSVRGIGATVASMLLIAALMTSETGLLGRLLSRPTPVYLGQVSYGTYLWHWPVILVIEEVLAVRPLVEAVLAVALSTGLAAMSFQLLETPIRSSDLLRRFRWSTVVVGVSVSALVALTVVPTALESQRRPRLVAAQAAPAAKARPAPTAGSGGVSAEERNAPVPQNIDWDSLLKSGVGPQPYCTVDAPDACVLAKGDGPHILIAGDSHANMLTPVFSKLAEKHDLTLSVNAMAACPWQSQLVNKRQPPNENDACLKVREDWYEHVLPELDPDLVILATRSRDEAEFWTPRLVRAGGSDETLPELLESTTLDTVDAIESKGPRVLLLDSLPTGERDPLDCLATAQRMYECEVDLPSSPPASDGYYEKAAKRSKKVFTASFNDVLCVGAPHCMPVVDGVVVWRDNAHFSTEFLLSRTDQLWRKIKKSGALRRR